MPSRIEETSQQMRKENLIAIVRGNFPADKLLAIGDALADSPLKIMEITLNTTSALETIRLLRQRFGERMIIGAGTVRTAEQFEAAVKAGAQFSVAPNLDLPTVEAAQGRDILHLPGVFTPTEAQTAYAVGCRMVKLFPSGVVGPRYLKALRAPLDDIEFVPTGGISAQNLGDYVKAGAVAVGIGSALVTGPDQSTDELRQRAQALRNAWDEAKEQK